MGVWIKNNLKPEKQVATSVNKAMATLRSICRLFVNYDKETFHTTYRTYVRPHLEYCVQAWAQYFEKDIRSRENVQRRATKMVNGMKNLSYEEWLKKLKMMSSQERRLCGDLIETYKLITGKVKVDASQFFELSYNLGTRGHSLKIVQKRAKLLPRIQFFSQRVVETWNSLHEEIVKAEKTEVLKCRFDQAWVRIWVHHRRLVSSLCNTNQLELEKL